MYHSFRKPRSFLQLGRQNPRENGISRYPLMPRSSERAAIKKPEAHQPLDLTELDGVASLRGGRKRLDRKYLVEQCDVRKNLTISRRHLETEDCWFDGASSRQTELCTLDEIGGAVEI